MATAPPPRRVLVVDDDDDIRLLLRELLSGAGYLVETAQDGRAALRVFHENPTDVVVLDLSMPDLDGFETLERLRDVSDVPVILLTARSGEIDKVRGFRGGADDYVVKPFGHRELLARIRAHARRASGERTRVAPAVLEVGPFRLDPSERTLFVDGVPTRLTGTEFRLLQYLMRHTDSVVPTEAVAKHVWGFNDAPARDVVRVTVHRLRRKLGDDGERQRFIHTVPGVGLRLRPG
jgi:DNA-binding response OmpR family regulator